MSEQFSIELNGVTGYAGLVQHRGIREAVYTGFVVESGEFRNSALAIELIRGGAELLKSAGAQYIYGTTKNPAIAFCFLSVTEGLVAYHGTELIEDVEALRTELQSKITEKTIMNRVDGLGCVESIPTVLNLEKEVWCGWPLNGPVVPHTHYMVVGPDKTILHIQAEKPTEGSYITTTKYLPGDERYFNISLNEYDTIQFVKKNTWE
ncbi:MAG: hypothetical protein AB7S52_02770 [Sphaerochaetaceae bacterium]